jgi:hypothetical protein
MVSQDELYVSVLIVFKTLCCLIVSIIKHKVRKCRFYVLLILDAVIKPVCSPETHIKRPATRHDCLPSLLGDGVKWIEIVYGETKIICSGPTRAEEPMEPTKEGPLSYVLPESPFASVSTVSRGHPYLVFLVQPKWRGTGVQGIPRMKRWVDIVSAIFFTLKFFSMKRSYIHNSKKS